MKDYWQQQTVDNPLFPELVWSRPENKRHAGKLLIIGGNSFGFSAVGEAYNEACQAGIGSARVLLPEAIRKVVGLVLEHAEYGVSNPSGSFSQKALGEWLDHSAWADAVLIAGELGRNSETAILFEKFLEKSTKPIVLTKDAIDYFIPHAKTYHARPNTTLVLTMSDLQKLATSLGFEKAFRLGMDLVQLVEVLHDFTEKFGLEIIVKHLETVCVSIGGQVSTTKVTDSPEVWRVKTAAHAVVWRLQNPTKLFEASTTSLVA